MNKLNIKQAIQVLRSGGSVIYPTDTLYGIGVDSSNEVALEKLVKLKGRDQSKKFSVLAPDIQSIEKVAKISPEVKKILMNHLPGPYTFILHSHHQGTIAVRIPNHPITLDLARAFSKPITATSANFSGQPPCNSLRSLKSLGADYLLWDGPLSDSKPSTIVDLTQKKPRLVRDGAGSWK